MTLLLTITIISLSMGSTLSLSVLNTCSKSCFLIPYGLFSSSILDSVYFRAILSTQLSFFIEVMICFFGLTCYKYTTKLPKNKYLRIFIGSVISYNHSSISPFSGYAESIKSSSAPSAKSSSSSDEDIFDCICKIIPYINIKIRYWLYI